MAAWYNLQRNRSGSVLGDLGVAQVGFSLLGPHPGGGGVVRRTWCDDFDVFCVYCGAG